MNCIRVVSKRTRYIKVLCLINIGVTKTKITTFTLKNFFKVRNFLDHTKIFIETHELQEKKSEAHTHERIKVM